MESLLQDLRFAFRTLRKAPAFTGFVILTLALGIGATTAIFTVVNRVLLQPLPYPDSNRIVVLVQRSGSDSDFDVSIPMYAMWRGETQILEDAMAQQVGILPVNLLGGEEPEQLRAMRVTVNFFAISGYRAAMGRTFTSQEDVPGGPPVAVITHGLWQSRFASDPHIVGKTVDLDNVTYTIIGILSPLPSTNAGMVDVFLPLQPDLNSEAQVNDYLACGRLKPGVTLAQADAALKFVTDQFSRRYPNILDRGAVFAAAPVKDLFAAGVRKALLLFLGAVGFVLLIACANVANLLLGRETGRQREIAIRVALGASRGRIIRQILTEGVLLSLVGGAVGLFLGYASVRALLALSPLQLPWTGQHGQAVTLDWRVLVFALGISALVGALSGLVPAVKVSRANLASAMRESGSRTGAGLRHNKTRSLLVVVEMALAMVLLAGAGLLIRTFQQLCSVNPGFQTRDVLTMNMSVAGSRFAKTAAMAELTREGQQRLDSLPGVEIAAATCCLPLEGGIELPFNIEGRAPTVAQWSGSTYWRSMSPGYFQAFRIPLLRGRAFTVNDSGSSQPVVIINEAMAKQFWPKGGELGARIMIAKDAGLQVADPPREIVGVVGDVRDVGLNYKPNPTTYVPVAQLADAMNALVNRALPMIWVIRTRVAPLSLNREIQEQLRIASGGLPVGHLRTMEQVVAQSTEQNSFNMTLLVIFAALALLLAAVGIYGVISYSVTQRTHEIGIRMVLGAQRRDVLHLLLGQGTQLALLGVGIGVIAAFALTRLMATLLYGVRATHPLTFIGVAILLTLVALLACYFPARRAMGVDPMVALRHE